MCHKSLTSCYLTACKIRVYISDMFFFPIDDIPVRGFIGHLEEGGLLPHSHKIYLWTHLHFNIEYNGDQVSMLFMYAVFIYFVAPVLPSRFAWSFFVNCFFAFI